MDACDKASKLLQCGKENAPEAVAGLMNNLENAMTVYYTILFDWQGRELKCMFQEAPIILPPQHAVCPVDYKCIVDVILSP
jgi:hypothetical protein